MKKHKQIPIFSTVLKSDSQRKVALGFTPHLYLSVELDSIPYYMVVYLIRRELLAYIALQPDLL